MKAKKHLLFLRFELRDDFSSVRSSAQGVSLVDLVDLVFELSDFFLALRDSRCFCEHPSDLDPRLLPREEIFTFSVKLRGVAEEGIRVLRGSGLGVLGSSGSTSTTWRNLGDLRSG